MSTRTLGLNDKIYDYLLSHSLREHPALTRLRDITKTLAGANMQISPEQGQLMALLVKLMGAVKTLDIGTFTGYSAGVVAAALPIQGSVITCDKDDSHRSLAEETWRELSVLDKINWVVAPALLTLQTLLKEDQAGTFDFVFIDADKTNYENYYELSLQLLRKQGLIAIDNTLWSGKVADPDHRDNATIVIRQFNEKLYQDERVFLSLVPIGDGLTLAIKQ